MAEKMGLDYVTEARCEQYAFFQRLMGSRICHDREIGRFMVLCGRRQNTTPLGVDE